MHYLDSDYAELLGLYLGDGHIVRAGRTQRLRLFLDTRYSGIIDDARSLLARSFPRNAVGMARSRRGTTTILSVYNSHLSCVFPQHGPGAKHKRAITLEEWQQNAVHAAPWAFIRGCIRSDGCAFVNRTGRYAYLSYEFRNYSRDILMLFAEACDEVGVKYRVYTTRVRMCQRPSVALLSENVGLKS